MKILKLMAFDEEKEEYDTILQAYENDKGRFYIELFLRKDHEIEKRWTTLDIEDAQSLIWELQRFIAHRSESVTEQKPNEN